MKAIVVHEKGGAEQLRYEDTEIPEIAASELLVKVEYAGINFIDIYFREGVYPIERPYTPGQDGSGAVEKVGAEVQGFQPGDRVAFPKAVSGSYAEYAVVSQQQAVKFPDSVASNVATAVMVQGLTAHYLSHSTFPLTQGDTALVHAAAGGVGLILTQMAKLRGATVIGTVSTSEKAELAKKAGADHIILYTEQDFVEGVKALTNGVGVSVVYDSVGVDTFAKSLTVLKPRGMMVTYGQSSGVIPPFDLLDLNRLGSLFVTRPTLWHYISGKGELQRRSDDIFTWLETGKLEVQIGQTYALEDARQAHEDLKNRKSIGKLLLQT